MNLLRHEDPAAPEAAAQALREGGVVLYPTDTLYGLGADAFSDAAVNRIYEIKGRDENKPIHAIVRDIEMAARYGEVDERVRRAIAQLPAGKVSFVVRKKTGLETGIARGINTFGFRIPDHAFCFAMLEAFGGPITATSANRSGEPPQLSLGATLAQLGSTVHLVVNGGDLPPSAPSTVVDCTGAEPIVLREGAVSAPDIFAALTE
jgi:L-threonylcarbamoyladenylate synthase